MGARSNRTAQNKTAPVGQLWVAGLFVFVLLTFSVRLDLGTLYGFERRPFTFLLVSSFTSFIPFTCPGPVVLFRLHFGKDPDKEGSCACCDTVSPTIYSSAKQCLLQDPGLQAARPARGACMPVPRILEISWGFETNALERLGRRASSRLHTCRFWEQHHGK